MIEISFEELEEHITTVSTGIKLVHIDGAGGGSTLLFRHPTSEEKMFARFVYKQTFQRALDDGMKTVDEMTEILRERGIISEESDQEIKKLEGKIEGQRAILAKTHKVAARQDRLIGIIKTLEEELKKLKIKRDRLLGLTAEAKANEAKLFFLCSKCVFRSEKERLWETEEDFNNERDLIFRVEVLSAFSEFVSGLPTSLIRYIARSNLWRVRYVTSVKTGADLFGRPISEYSPDMVNLLYWSHYYQSVYEMMPEDQPSDDVITDDAALDAYMDNYYKELKNERAARSGRTSGSLNAFDQGDEVIVTPAHELHKDFEYDKPKEAQKLPDRVDIRKRAKKKRKRNLKR
jgi:hypothetical protein